jgi:hypothetical protein
MGGSRLVSQASPLRWDAKVSFSVFDGGVRVGNEWHARLKNLVVGRRGSLAYFTTDKLLRLAEIRGARAAYVHDAQRAAADNVYLVERVVKRVLPLVRDEARDFADTFGEPLPPHMQRSLEAEIDMWSA